MTMGKALYGKPYAGNPHVRFDEGEVASCTAEASLRRVHCRRQPEGRASVCAAMPRRGSLLYKTTANSKRFWRVAVVAGCIAVNCAMAGTSTWRSGSTGGWSDPNSWDGGVPDSTSTVAVPNGVDLPVADADVAAAGSVAAVSLGEGSRIIFNLESTDCSMSGTITGSGTIVKNGAATLNLLSETANGYKTTGGMQVNAGTLVCPQSFSGSYSSVRMGVGPVYVAEGATFKPYAKYRTTVITSLTGKGTVRQTLTGGYWPLRITENSSFEGKLYGPIVLSIYGKIDLLGTDSYFYSDKNLSLNSGADLGVAKFGNRDDSTSSLQSWYTSSGSRCYKDLSFAGDAFLRYLGTGEITDRHFRIGSTANATVDAGAIGNLHLKGRFYKDEAGQAVLTLAGSNTVAASFNGGFDEFGDNSTYIAKSGTGTWTLFGSETKLNAGVVGVEEGTLQFDTLAETNIPCSFGMSTRLAQKYTGSWDATRTADYAILLGSSDAEGRLEYIGTNLWDNAASTRPVAVTGRGGRIVSSVAGRRIGIKGALAADSGGGTLTLDGVGTTNYLYNAADGHGALSIAKEGSGTWVLAGDQTFGGKLDVKGGELIVSSTLGAKYSWYRFTLKRNYASAIGSTSGDWNQIRMWELALYDQQGNRLNRGLLYNETLNAIPSAGTACYWGRMAIKGLSPLFDEQSKWASGNPYLYNINLNPVPDTDVPSTWIRIVMHIDESKASAASYDICGVNGWEYAGSPNAWTMEASADGVFWDTVANVTSNETVYSGGHWISDDSAWSSNAKRIPSHPNFVFGLDNGKSLLQSAPSQLANATVSVANDAVLRADGSVEISSIEVDVTKPAGTIDGFALASGGTLVISGIDSFNSTMTLPINFSNMSGMENISGWSLKIGNKPSRGKIAYRNGQLSVKPSGMMIVLF